MRMIDLTGQRFGRLTVLHRSNKKTSHVSWVCKCDCGKIVSVVGCDLRNGHTNSCGCYHKDQAKAFLTNLKSKNENFHKSKTRVYHIWKDMMRRCYDNKTKYFNYYGGRGIAVCESWHSYSNFLKDMGNPPTDKHTIDRIDTNGNYCKENCRWVTMQKQNNNRRSCLKITLDGITYSGKEFATSFNLRYDKVLIAYRNGLLPNEILKFASH